MTLFAFSRVLVLVAAAFAAAPAIAQRQSLADRVARLEQQAATQTSSSGQANVELLNRLTQMQGEVQALRNKLEQLQNENEQLKQRNRDQYVDLDTRIQRIEGGAAPAPGSAGAGRQPTPPAATGSESPAPAAPEAPTSPVDDQGAYTAAFEALKQGDYVESARAFQAYLRAFPQGALAPNAWYWLGESYYVTQNYPIALQAFESLLAQFPDSAKAPDALLKKGYCQIEIGQVGPGKATLNRVINDYPGTDAARLAVSRLRAPSLDTN